MLTRPTNQLNLSKKKALLSPPELLTLDLKRNSLTSIAHLDFTAAGNLEQFDVSHNTVAGTIPGPLASDSFITVVELGSVRLHPTMRGFVRACVRAWTFHPMVRDDAQACLLGACVTYVCVRACVVLGCSLRVFRYAVSISSRVRCRRHSPATPS